MSARAAAASAPPPELATAPSLRSPLASHAQSLQLRRAAAPPRPSALDADERAPRAAVATCADPTPPCASAAPPPTAPPRKSPPDATMHTTASCEQLFRRHGHAASTRPMIPPTALPRHRTTAHMPPIPRAASSGEPPEPYRRRPMPANRRRSRPQHQRAVRALRRRIGGRRLLRLHLVGQQPRWRRLAPIRRTPFVASSRRRPQRTPLHTSRRPDRRRIVAVLRPRCRRTAAVVILIERLARPLPGLPPLVRRLHRGDAAAHVVPLHNEGRVLALSPRAVRACARAAVRELQPEPLHNQPLHVTCHHHSSAGGCTPPRSRASARLSAFITFNIHETA